MLRRQLRPALVTTLLLCVLTGIIYPGIVTGLAQVFFPRQANGSLVRAHGRTVGSTLIGQPFARPEYFHPRPSAAGAGYDATASGGSNRGPTDRALAAAVGARVNSAVATYGVLRDSVPTDFGTASASGLDPDISPANARMQAARVAAARGVSVAAVRALVERHVAGRQFRLFGDPRVNVLLLNLALDSAFGAPPGRRAAR